MKMATAVVCVTEMAVMDLWLWLNMEPVLLFKTADSLRPEFKSLRPAAQILGRKLAVVVALITWPAAIEVCV